MTVNSDLPGRPWTVGDLRSALSTLPLSDDYPIHVVTAERPGDFNTYETHMLIAAEPEVTRTANEGGSRDILLLLADHLSQRPET